MASDSPQPPVTTSVPPAFQTTRSAGFPPGQLCLARRRGGMSIGRGSFRRVFLRMCFGGRRQEGVNGHYRPLWFAVSASKLGAL